jgi:uncharacterized protein (DUF779 family)
LDTIKPILSNVIRTHNEEKFIGRCPFYTSKAQYETWKHTQLIIDVIAGSCGDFSFETPEGKGFHTRSRVFTESELAELANFE